MKLNSLRQWLVALYTSPESMVCPLSGAADQQLQLVEALETSVPKLQPHQVQWL